MWRKLKWAFYCHKNYRKYPNKPSSTSIYTWQCLSSDFESSKSKLWETSLLWWELHFKAFCFFWKCFLNIWNLWKSMPIFRQTLSVACLGTYWNYYWKKKIDFIFSRFFVFRQNLSFSTSHCQLKITSLCVIYIPL